MSLAYGYDGSLVTSTTWAGNVAGSVGWTYNNDFRVVSESVNGANSVTFGYDNDGLLTSVDGLSIVSDPANGLITDATLGQVTGHRTYDSYAKLATYEAKFGTTSLYSVVYVRDSLGRIAQRAETIQGTTTVWNYSYDQGGRLWQALQNGVLMATCLYDANGNRISLTTPTGTQTASYDDQDRLLTSGSWTYAYTANGELQSKTDTSNGQVTTYAYDARGNLRHVGLPDGRAIDYLVDSENRRVAKKVNGAVVRKWFYGDLLIPAAEFDGSGALLARYLGGVTIKGGTSCDRGSPWYASTAGEQHIRGCRPGLRFRRMGPGDRRQQCWLPGVRLCGWHLRPGHRSRKIRRAGLRSSCRSLDDERPLAI
jgi:YD repeat-containing protein